ncbi:GDSL-type esterase/lipase family protein [Paenibacillus macerans]|uniref:SGNH/GDSL hydrolase family protein n=1 Tax=Paenibacillus macerans TaxID=44252 RepID=UPI003D31E664
MESKHVLPKGFKLILVGFLLFAILGILPARTYSATGDGSPGDSNIHYFGRWDKSVSTQYTSYWPGAYFKVKFTGTSVKINLGGSVNMYASIDGGSYIAHTNVSGIVNLTPVPLSAGTHSLVIAAKDRSDFIIFNGLLLDGGATTQPPSLQGNFIEFIGDSVTTGYLSTNAALSAYAWITAEQLNAEHSQIAYPGICLTDNVACYSPNSIGMSRQYFKLQTVAFPSSPDWDFTLKQPTAVVINLGSNDDTFNVPDFTFQDTYTTFLQNIRAKYPSAKIFVLRTFRGFKSVPTLAAVNTRISAGDVNLHYIDTTGWLGSADYIDGRHPTDRGHQKAANLLTTILQPYLVVKHPGFEIDQSHELNETGKMDHEYQDRGGR